MIEAFNKIKILKEREIIGETEEIKLRANVQRNRLSAITLLEIILKLSDEIEELKNKFNEFSKSDNLEPKQKSKAKE